MDPPPVQIATTSDGKRVAYGVSGSGTPLIFLGGTFYHVQLAWQYPGLSEWLQQLAERFLVVQIDPRGAGMSDRNVEDGHVLQHYQRDLAAVVEKLGLARFVIYGAAAGVDIAVDYTLAHPQQVIALVFGTSGTIRSAAQFSVLPAEDWEAFLYSIVPRDRSMDEAHKIVALLKQGMDAKNYLMRRSVMAPTDEMQRMLSSLRQPVLVMHTRGYPFTPVEEAMKVAQYSRGRLVVIDGADAWGDPEQGIRTIDAFLRDVLPASMTDDDGDSGLSPRELEVLRLIAAGKSNQQIADELVLSYHTVGRHVSNILDKIGAANRVEAAVYARERGLL